MITSLKDWKNHKNKLVKESVTRTADDIKPYDDVIVGDMAFENPDAGGVWDNELGKVLWKGTYTELLDSEYSNLTSDWEIEHSKDENQTDEKYMAEYDLIVIANEYGPTLFNYNNDPSGCVVFKVVEEGRMHSGPSGKKIKFAPKSHLDKVGEEDKDINNDGEVNKQDDYLANRRKVISSNIDENNTIKDLGSITINNEENTPINYMIGYNDTTKQVEIFYKSELVAKGENIQIALEDFSRYAGKFIQ